MNLFKSAASLALARADVRTDGARAFDLVVYDERFYRRALLEGSMGLGESFVEGWWDCQDVEELVYRLIASGLAEQARLLPGFVALNSLARLINLQPRSVGARAARHYNTDNDLFAALLGQYKIYSCAYYRDEAESLDAGQRHKLDTICDRLDLRASDHVLDVGGGWGEIARHMAATRGCHVTSINIAEEQMRYARALCTGLPVDVVHCDYRDIRGAYDKISMIAMMSHVGVKNHRALFQRLHDVLAPGGLLMIDTVGSTTSLVHGNPWIDKYIFPGAVFPSLAQISQAAEGLFVVEEVQSQGPSYVRTLRAWKRNLEAAWPRLAGRHDERTRRMFGFFFDAVAGFFRAREFTNYYLVLSRAGVTAPRARTAAEPVRSAAVA
jgi:cyclopropane-fatty-acyl-phospholipid synthase